jgi:membrane fusion protein (multidrug efflux system)
VGQSVVARSAAFDREFKGLIRAVDSRVDPVTRSVQVRAELPNDSGLLKPGLLMNTRVEANPRRTLLIPEQSLESRASSHYVWRLNSAGQAEKVQVEIGSRSPGVIEILSGLQAGDEIVTDGVGSLRASPADVKVGG